MYSKPTLAHSHSHAIHKNVIRFFKSFLDLLQDFRKPRVSVCFREGQQGRGSLSLPHADAQMTLEKSPEKSLTLMAMSAPVPTVPMGSAVASSPCSSTPDHPDAGKKESTFEPSGFVPTDGKLQQLPFCRFETHVTCKGTQW